MYQHAKAADGLYQAVLRAELTERLGVRWAKRDDAWEVEGVPAGLCREWSKRRSQIERALAARGLDVACASGRAAQAATLDTRQAKVKVEPEGSLHDRFAREATQAGHDPAEVLTTVLRRDRQPAHESGERGGVELLDEAVGAQGVTERASSFSRQEAISDLADRHAIHARAGCDAAARVEHLADLLVGDERVVPVLAPAARTSGELLRVRDESGRIVRTVNQAERRYTTVDLLAAEHDLITRATNRRAAGVAVVPAEAVDRVLAEHPNLDGDQAAMVRTLAASGAGVDVVVGKAGTGKSTAIGAYRAALDAAGIPVIGVAPSATAAHQLGMAAGISDTATVDRLLVELEHGHRRLPHGCVVILDEAAMTPTRSRLALQQAVDAVRGAADHGSVATATATTPHGRHNWFRLPDGMLVPRSIRGLGDGIDLLGSDGYAMAPPSTITTCPKHHASDAACGTAYTWTPRTRRLAPLPAWIPRRLQSRQHACNDRLDNSKGERPPAAEAEPSGHDGHMRHARRYALAALRGETERVAGAEAGRRNDTLNYAAWRLARHLRSGALTEAEIRDALAHAADACGLTTDDGARTVHTTITSALRSGGRSL